MLVPSTSVSDYRRNNSITPARLASLELNCSIDHNGLSKESFQSILSFHQSNVPAECFLLVASCFLVLAIRPSALLPT